VEQAFETVSTRPSLMVLLGMAANRPEVEYGWIEPGEAMTGVTAPVWAVRRFWEKPVHTVAERLLGRGCLWNSFVIVACPATLLSLVETAAPSLAGAFAPLRHRMGTPWEARAAETLYATLPSIDFSRTVITSCSGRLAVLPASRSGVGDDRPRRRPQGGARCLGGASARGQQDGDDGHAVDDLAVQHHCQYGVEGKRADVNELRLVRRRRHPIQLLDQEEVRGLVDDALARVARRACVNSAPANASARSLS
jgi:hypothetical protein